MDLPLPPPRLLPPKASLTFPVADSPGLLMNPVVPPSRDDARKILISSMVLMSEYAALFVSAVVILLIVCLRSTTRLRTRLVYFYVITIIIALVRVVGWSLEPWWKYSDTQWQKYLHSILFALPAMCLISTYTILISYWADEYVTLRTPGKRVRNTTRKFILICVNVIIYTGEAIILTMNFWKPTMYHLVQSHFLNVLYILAVTAFILYGFGLYRTWQYTPVARKSEVNLRRMRLTLTITIIVAISFTIRVIVNAIRQPYIEKWSFKYPFEVIFYTGIEIFPIALLLWLMLASGFRRVTKDVAAFKPLIAQADVIYTDGESDYDTADEDEPVDTPGGIFD